MQNATFDIWSGTPQKTGRYLETVTGLGNSQKRMLETATEAPGPYFIFSASSGCILDQIDTREDSFTTLLR